MNGVHGDVLALEVYFSSLKINEIVVSACSLVGSVGIVVVAVQNLVVLGIDRSGIVGLRSAGCDLPRRS